MHVSLGAGLDAVAPYASSAARTISKIQSPADRVTAGRARVWRTENGAV